MSLPVGEQSRKQDYFRARLRMRIFQKLTAHMTRYVKEHQLTRRDIAKLAGKSPAQITRWLSSPANLQLDTISDMLLATDAELVVEVRPISRERVATSRAPAAEVRPQGPAATDGPATSSSREFKVEDWSTAA